MSVEAKKAIRRTHVTTACTACRESKVKCDGDRPKCGNCKKGTAKACVYQQGEDRRRISLRKAIEVFSARVSQLEAIIHEHGLAVPSIATEDEALIKKMLDYIKPHESSPPKQGAKSNHGHTITDSVVVDCNQRIEQPPETFAMSTDDQSGEFLEPQHTMMMMNDGVDLLENIIGDSYTLQPSANFMEIDPTGFNFETLDWNAAFPELPPGVASAWDEINYSHSDEQPVHERETFDEDEESIDSSDGDKDEVISQISERMGSLQVADDGEFRYFGATSNLNLLDEAIQQNNFETDPIRSRGSKREDNARLSHHVDAALITHLISLYFAWQDPTFHVVDRKMYEEKQKLYESGTDDSTFYSETLTHSMCAFGALYETRRHPHLPTPLSEFFSAKAKLWLEVELDSPRVATIQALVIMSSYEAASTRDARGWLYSGMSMRLSLDLGLHTDMAPYVQNGQMSSEEAQIRGVTFWGSFIVDQSWGYYLGRPPIHIRTEEISAQKPTNLVDAARFSSWGPYGMSTPMGSVASSALQLNDPTELVSRNWIDLCEIMSGSSLTLFGFINVTKHALQAVAEKTVERLRNWHNGLPPELKVELGNEGGVYIPHVLILQMQYYQFMIYIHRPFISRYRSQPYPPVGRGHNHARTICIESAVAISNLLTKYGSAYTLRFINIQAVSIVFSAALILVFATVSEISSDTHIGLNTHLSTCCKGLAELGKTFQNATRALEALLSIKRAWQAKLLVNTGSKRRSSSVRTHKTSAKKRTMS